MPSYADLARRMEARSVAHQPHVMDLYKSDRAAIDQRREELARELRLSHLRLELDLQRFAR